MVAATPNPHELHTEVARVLALDVIVKFPEPVFLYKVMTTALDAYKTWKREQVWRCSSKGTHRCAKPVHRCKTATAQTPAAHTPPPPAQNLHQQKLL
jgi:hypothetical protein